MKIIYYVVVLLALIPSILHAQEVRVNNSFIILVNNKLATAVAGLTLILSDSTGKEEIISGGYYPGVLYVKNIETKNILMADSLRRLTLVFNNYYDHGKTYPSNNYRIAIDRRWFRESLIIVRIDDINRRRGTYKYSFEVSGHHFGKILKQ
jgi:hypothetical protein